MNHHLRIFSLSYVVTLFCMCIAGWWGYNHGGMATALGAVWITAVLGVMEVSLSFDNAVVNASVLRHWNAFWQRLFLTVGILVAVFGMRLLFPLLIVSITTDLGLLAVWNMAMENPSEYSERLQAHHAEVSAFGGMFLMLVFLNFVLDESKDHHWIEWLEQRLARLGKINAISVFISLMALLVSLSWVPEESELAVLTAGIWGIVIYQGVDVISIFLGTDENDKLGDNIRKGSVGGFLYLEVLDASFSFDGVIGAFAITRDVVIIMLGLAIGAMFVRSLTVYLVQMGTLEKFVFLEHGAHWAIGLLAGIMLVSMNFHVPEAFTGLAGVGIILLSLWSSVKYRKEIAH